MLAHVALLMALSAQADSSVVFLNVNVVDVDRGTVADHRAVVVRDGVITRVAAADGFAVPARATVVPGNGRYLMPGLIDSHVHVHDPEDLVLFLAYGVTEARILDGEPSDLRMRDDADAGDEMRPRLRVCRQVDSVDGPADAVRTVDRAKANGFDCLKLYSPPSWTLESYRALARAAHDAGIRLEGHLPRNLSLSGILAGDAQGSIAHLEETLYTHFFLDENRLGGRVDSAQAVVVARLITEKGVTMGTTLNNYRTVGNVAGRGFDSLKALPELAYVPRRVRARWFDGDNLFRRRVTAENSGTLLTILYPVLEKLAREIVAQGGTLALGTDASWNLPFMIPGVSVLWEMEALVEAGLTPAQVIRAATVNAAGLLGEERMGRVEAGYVADLVLLDGNPEEDITRLSRVAGVMRGGMWFPADRLRSGLQRLAEKRR